jgi:hypothetical protein
LVTKGRVAVPYSPVEKPRKSECGRGKASERI